MLLDCQGLLLCVFLLAVIVRRCPFFVADVRPSPVSFCFYLFLVWGWEKILNMCVSLCYCCWFYSYCCCFIFIVVEFYCCRFDCYYSLCFFSDDALLNVVNLEMNYLMSWICLMNFLMNLWNCWSCVVC